MHNIISKKAELDSSIQERYKKIKSDIDYLEYNTGYKTSINLAQEYAHKGEESNASKIRDMAGLLVQYSAMLQKADKLDIDTYPVVAINSMRLRGMIEGLIAGAKAFFNIDLSNEFTKWISINESLIVNINTLLN